MTAQSSAVNSGGVFYKFLPYYLYKVKHLRSQMIMSIIFSVLSYPLMGAVLIPTFTAAKEYYDLPYSMSTAASDEAMMALRAAQAKLDEMSQYAITAIVIACLCLVGLFIFTFVTTLRSFRYLYNKTVVDMDYSLPISHNTRFFGDLAAVFTVSILPHLVAAIIGSILLGFCPLSENMGSMCAIPVAIGQAAVTGVFSCIMLIGICLLMLSFCGRMAEACIYPILVNFAIPVIHSLVIDLVESGVFGAVVTESSSDVFSRYFAISSTSPLGLITMTIYSWCATADSSGDLGAAPVSRPEFLIPAILITLACMAGAYFLIKHRRAERVGMSYVYKGMDLIIPGIVIFAMTMPVCSSVISNLKAGSNIPPVVYIDSVVNIPGLVIGTLITTFIVYIIMELISGKNFRKFWQSALKWAGTLAAGILVCVLLHSSNGFGAAYFVPQPSTVKSVGVYYYDGRDDDNNYLIQKRFRFYAEKGDNELLALVEKLHSEILDNGMKASSDRCYVAFNYVMNDGSSLCREYRIDEALFESIAAVPLNAKKFQAILDKC